MLLELSDNYGYSILSMFTYNGRLSVLQFIVDSGSEYTCCHASSIGTLSEEYCELMQYDKEFQFGVLQGDNSLSVCFYKIPVDNFSLGSTIKLGRQFIYVTFDDRFSSLLLGRDILNKMYFYHAVRDEKLCLSVDYDEIKEMVETYQ